MPFVPAYDPNNRPGLVSNPSQQSLNQTYGPGGGFIQPPTTTAQLVPNATALVDPAGGDRTADNDAAAGPSQIAGSPLAQRTSDREGGGSGTPSEQGSVSVQQGPASRTALGVISMIPGASIATGFVSVMQALGIVGVVGGPGTERPMVGTQLFDDVVAAGQQARGAGNLEAAQEAEEVFSGLSMRSFEAESAPSVDSGYSGDMTSPGSPGGGVGATSAGPGGGHPGTQADVGPGGDSGSGSDGGGPGEGSGGNQSGPR